LTRFRYQAGEESARAGDSAERYSVTLRHGTLELGYYSPVGVDPQQPHEQDEIYVIVTGTGRFLCGLDESEFGPGDALFVPAGVEHRFVDFTEDTEMWVVFYGPPGGELSD
jgi:mannose-6-phosphate isomerase-like protein (cupin superfamily)